MGAMPETKNSLGMINVPCTSKMATVCRIDIPDTVSPSHPSEFPCIKLSDESRRKRSDAESKQTNKIKQTGKLLYWKY